MKRDAMLFFVLLISLVFNPVLVYGAGHYHSAEVFYGSVAEGPPISVAQFAFEMMLLFGERGRPGFKEGFVIRTDADLRKWFQYSGSFWMFDSWVEPGVRVDENGMTNFDCHAGLSLKKSVRSTDGAGVSEVGAFDWGMHVRTDFLRSGLFLEGSKKLPIGSLLLEGEIRQDLTFKEAAEGISTLKYRVMF